MKYIFPIIFLIFLPVISFAEDNITNATTTTTISVYIPPDFIKYKDFGCFGNVTCNEIDMQIDFINVTVPTGFCEELSWSDASVCCDPGEIYNNKVEWLCRIQFMMNLGETPMDIEPVPKSLISSLTGLSQEKVENYRRYANKYKIYVYILCSIIFILFLVGFYRLKVYPRLILLR